jgi:hypothetical protein
VDPDLAETDQPYAYAGDDPLNSSDPTGLNSADLGSDCVTLPTIYFYGRSFELAAAQEPYGGSQQGAGEGPPTSEQILSAQNEGTISLVEARELAAEAGLDLNGIDLGYEYVNNDSQYGFSSTYGDGSPIYNAEGNLEITLTNNALKSEEQTVKTIAHEMEHLRRAQAGEEVWGPDAETAAEQEADKAWGTYLERTTPHPAQAGDPGLLADESDVVLEDFTADAAADAGAEAGADVVFDIVIGTLLEE